MTSFAANAAAARSLPIHTIHGYEVAAGDLIGFRESISGEERFARYIRPLGNGLHMVAFDENDEMEGFNDAIREWQIFALFLGDDETEMVVINRRRRP